MILVVSTSTSLASVALFDGAGREAAGLEREAPRAASQAVLEMIEELDLDLEQAAMFVADGGPGSFTGVKVAATLVKMWAWLYGRPAAVLSSFALAEPATLVLPARRGHRYRQDPAGGVSLEEGEAPEGIRVSARHAGPLIRDLAPVDPAVLAPIYGGLPNVSQAKNPLIMGGQ